MNAPNKNWKIRLSMVSPDGNYVDITGPEKGKRASFDYLSGSLILMIAANTCSREIKKEHREAMEKCLDVLWPEWRKEENSK